MRYSPLVEAAITLAIVSAAIGGLHYRATEAVRARDESNRAWLAKLEAERGTLTEKGLRCGKVRVVGCYEPYKTLGERKAAGKPDAIWRKS